MIIRIEGFVKNDEKQQFAVIGLGRFGSSLAQELMELGYEVLGIDKMKSSSKT